MKKLTFKSKILTIIILFTVILVISCCLYLNDYYHADMEAIEAYVPVNAVEIQEDSEGNFVFVPDNAKTGMIFYPGGKVENDAYIPFMEELASRGVLCVLVEMPFNLAVFDIDAADGIQSMYPQVEEWYIGGHSLGGSMAASYVASNLDEYEGLVLLGSYSTEDLSETDLDVISIYGSEDKVMNYENYKQYKSNLPEDYIEVIIEGGCHSFFGMYGAQEGDGIPTISNEEQIKLTADAIISIG